jgi:hypothetical protein
MPSNAERVGRAAIALHKYEERYDPRRNQEPIENLVDLLTDLLHLAHYEKPDLAADDLVQMALTNFNEEM